MARVIPIPAIDVTADQWAIVRGILQRHVPGHAVWALGSRARRSAKKFSNLDLAIVTAQPLSLALCAALRDDQRCVSSDHRV